MRTPSCAAPGRPRRTPSAGWAAATLVLFAAACGAASEPAAPASPSSARAPASPALRARMREHDAHGAAMRDAVASANLGAARREAAVLRDLEPTPADDPEWVARLQAMRSAAARLAAAADLPEAARRLAEVAQTCGDCHAAQGGPRPMVAVLPSEGPGVQRRMQRHQWAVARLWDGLIVPSAPAWKVGASVLTDAPLEPELYTPGKAPELAISALASSVRDLALKARVATTNADRGAVYGDLMATCAACHGRVAGGGPSGH